MRFTAAIISALLSSGLVSPHPNPEADPGYKVVKTVQIWDDDTDAAKRFEDIDLIPQRMRSMRMKTMELSTLLTSRSLLVKQTRQKRR